VTPQGEALLHSRLVGRFNLYNILGAVAAAIALELPLSAIISGIAGHTAVPGRLERVESDSGISVFVDYAHTGDALENVLTTISEFAHQRVITLFGCGGDRDRGKRPVMAAIAGRLSDLTIITSDNPRTEEPEAIIAEVRSGILPLALREYSADQLSDTFTDKGFITITDRQQAIQAAIRVAHPGDIVLLAGKGHEDYQIIGTVKHHFDDREEAAAALRSHQGSGN
ncbi:MAG TPA: cyanophycin synthetase, partial [Geobacterales bacterium]|nr:cyanophycin synthetase [Geobacterales bacterium]